MAVAEGVSGLDLDTKGPGAGFVSDLGRSKLPAPICDCVFQARLDNWKA